MRLKSCTIIGNNKAFTILEVIVVIALISIISAIVVPKMDVFERYCLTSASKQLKSDIMFVQDITINSEQAAKLKFVGDDTYYIYLGSSSDAVWKKVTLAGIQEITYDRSNMPELSNIQFTIYGTTKNGARSIKLFTKKYYQEITITLGSGSVRISEIKIK